MARRQRFSIPRDVTTGLLFLSYSNELSLA
jgi:hypothetical protein